MGYKYKVGDIVFMENSESPTNAAILHIHIRETRRFGGDIFSHKYYHGSAFGLARDDNSGLYVPLSHIDPKQWGPKYKTIWSAHHRESELETINSEKVDITKIFPFILEDPEDYQDRNRNR